MSYQLLKIGIYIYKYTTQGRPFLEESSLPPPDWQGLCRNDRWLMVSLVKKKCSVWFNWAYGLRRV